MKKIIFLASVIGLGFLPVDLVDAAMQVQFKVNNASGRADQATAVSLGALNPGDVIGYGPELAQLNAAGLNTEGRDPGIVVRAHNDSDAGWKLTVRSTGLVNQSDPTQVIDGTNFQWVTGYVGFWTDVPGFWSGYDDDTGITTRNIIGEGMVQKTFTPFSGVSQIAYRSTVLDTNHFSRGINGGTEVTIALKTQIPSRAVAGRYVGNVVFEVSPQ
jgi:hypothetical protein